jgi:hypothetical protein
VRHAHFGEGEYPQTEKLIRNLLGVDRGSMTEVRDETPTGSLTPESYIGYGRADRFAGDRAQDDQSATYHFPSTLPLNDLAFGGTWTVLKERAVTGGSAGLRVHFQASKVYLVLGGHGSVDVLVNGKNQRRIRVDGDRLYTLVDSTQVREALLELRFTPGISAYAFTFG